MLESSNCTSDCWDTNMQLTWQMRKFWLKLTFLRPQIFCEVVVCAILAPCTTVEELRIGDFSLKIVSGLSWLKMISNGSGSNSGTIRICLTQCNIIQFGMTCYSTMGVIGKSLSKKALLTLASNEPIMQLRLNCTAGLPLFCTRKAGSTSYHRKLVLRPTHRKFLDACIVAPHTPRKLVRAHTCSSDMDIALLLESYSMVLPVHIVCVSTIHVPKC